MQPRLMEPGQIEHAIQSAKDDQLALVIELPHGELIVTDARMLQDLGRQRYSLGDSVTFDVSRVRHVRAVAPVKIKQAFHDLQSRD